MAKRTAYATSARNSKVIGSDSPSTTTFTCAVLNPVALTFMVTGTSRMPGMPAVCAGISLPVISIVVHWQDGCAPNTFSGLSDVLASLKFPSSNVCGATTPKSNPAGMAITLALAAGAEAARIGLPTGLVKAEGAGVCAVVGACANTTVDCTNAADSSAAIVFAHVRACAWANTVNTKICIRVCIFNFIWMLTFNCDFNCDFIRGGILFNTAAHS